MGALAIEINGAGLLVCDGDEVLANEPGYAIVDESGIVTGAEAYRQARLQPSKARSGFWSGLAADGGAAQANAELAYEHLRSVWQQAGRPDSPAVLVVPGGFSAEQLGLVLGIAHECGIAVSAMVDSAAAASAVRYEGAQLFYVDASLKSVSVTRLQQTDAAIAEKCEMTRALGLADLYDETARAVARVFVMQTRFDPLHDAKTEQAIYDGLPAWLEALHDEESVTARLQHGGDELAVELTLEQLRSASLKLFREIARLIGELRTPGVAAVIQLNERLAKLPGLRNELDQIDNVVVVELEAGFAARSALQRLNPQAAAEQVQLLRRLPFSHTRELPATLSKTASREASAQMSTQTSTRPGGAGTVALAASDVTHFAIKTANGALVLERSSQSRVLVNDAQVESVHRLAAGDVICIGEDATKLHVVVLEQ